jgi:hypothetical protein
METLIERARNILVYGPVGFEAQVRCLAENAECDLGTAYLACQAAKILNADEELLELGLLYRHAEKVRQTP